MLGATTAMCPAEGRPTQSSQRSYQNERDDPEENVKLHIRVGPNCEPGIPNQLVQG
jgi:hypothetical protein